MSHSNTGRKPAARDSAGARCLSVEVPRLPKVPASEGARVAPFFSGVRTAESAGLRLLPGCNLSVCSISYHPSRIVVGDPLQLGDAAGMHTRTTARQTCRCSSELGARSCGLGTSRGLRLEILVRVVGIGSLLCSTLPLSIFLDDDLTGVSRANSICPLADSRTARWWPSVS